MTAARDLRLYGVPFSQPVRAVAWLLVIKRLPFEMVPVNPGSSGRSGSRNPAYLAMNPAGTIPCIEEPAQGFVLAEAHAILCYLCRRHGWTDFYPDDEQRRARVDWYLHFHHRTIREGSIGLVAPKIRKDIELPAAVQDAARANFHAGLEALEQGWLAQQRYLAGDAVTIADLAAYVEIGQLRPCFTNVFDLDPFPNVQRWLSDMAAVDGHDVVHAALSALGDISREPPSMDTIRNANKHALEVLQHEIERMGRP